jgi:exosortase/archaeosortase family protein
MTLDGPPEIRCQEGTTWDAYFLATPWGDQLLYRYLHANAWLSSGILDTLGQHTLLSDITIQSPKFSVTVQRGCDAVEPTWLICAAMLSISAPWTHRILGILVGILLLQTLNLLRIISLFLIGVHWPRVFNSAHLEIWPVAFVVIAIALFIYWREWTCRRQELHASL